MFVYCLIDINRDYDSIMPLVRGVSRGRHARLTALQDGVGHLLGVLGDLRQAHELAEGAPRQWAGDEQRRVERPVGRHGPVLPVDQQTQFQRIRLDATSAPQGCARPGWSPDALACAGPVVSTNASDSISPPPTLGVPAAQQELGADLAARDLDPPSPAATTSSVPSRTPPLDDRAHLRRDAVAMDFPIGPQMPQQRAALTGRQRVPDRLPVAAHRIDHRLPGVAGGRCLPDRAPHTAQHLDSGGRTVGGEVAERVMARGGMGARDQSRVARRR